MAHRSGRPVNVGGKSDPIDWRVALSDATLLGLIVYIGITAWRHSDAELINPETRIHLPTIPVDTIPTGRIIAPLLDIELSVFTFYLSAPIVVLAAHVLLVALAPRRDSDFRSAFWKAVATLLPPAVLLMLLWKFAPYMHARPCTISTSSAGWWLTRLHTLVVSADTVVVAFGLLATAESGVAPTYSWLQPRARLVRRILVAGKLAALFSLPPIAVAWMLEFPHADRCTEDPVAWSYIFLELAVIVLGLALVAIVIWGMRSRNVVGRLIAGIIVANGMSGRRTVVTLVAIASVLMLAPALIFADTPRPLDLAGARLFAREPAEVLMAAVIAATPGPTPDKGAETTALTEAQLRAWEAFGQGIDLSWWHLPGVSFQGASMQLINLSNANLRRTNFIRANLAGADLTRANFEGATLIEADLRKVKFIGAGLLDNKLILAADENPDGQRRPTQRQVPSSINLSGANLAGANLSGAQLSGAILARADLTRATISADTDLSGADLRGANLRDATVLSRHLANTMIAGANFCGANLTGAHLFEADWLTPEGDDPKAKPTKPTFRYANLVGAKLPGALAGLDLTRAIIRDLEFVRRRVDGAIDKVTPDLSEAKLMYVNLPDYSGKCEDGPAPEGQ